MNLRYILTGVVRHHLPASALFAMMRLSGDGNGAEQIPDQNAADLVAHLAAEGISLRGRHVLELGSGQYARLALRLLAEGARRVTLVDLYALSLSDPAHRKLLRDDCAQLGLDLDEALGRITVYTGDFLRLPVPTMENQPDLAISTAVLEHVRDPNAIFAHCHAWLAPGGITFHIVDLRDHSMQFRYPFEMLTFSDHTWQRWLDHPGGFHLNRWRTHDHIKALAEAGFEQITYASVCADKQALRVVRPRLHSRYRQLPDALLAIQVLHVFGRKPKALTP
jgi:SAM-dependent methyltransferase